MNMKLTSLGKLLVLGLAVTFAASGCKKHPVNETRIPDYEKNRIGDPNALPPIRPEATFPFDGGTNIAGTPIPMTDPSKREAWVRDAGPLKSDTVYFDFDSTVVKSGEKSKVANVANYLKNNPGHALEVDGHCDERGTEEYNRALGERRALALREELAKLGVDPGLVDTVSYGKDRPAMPGHDDLAHKKNRRGEFLLESPPSGAK